MKRKRIRKIVNGVMWFLMLIGLYIIIGTAGASDLNLIDTTTVAVRGGIGVLIMLVSYIGLKATGCKHII